MINSLYKYKIIDENGNTLGFKKIDVVRDKIEYFDNDNTKIKKPSGKTYLQQYVFSKKNKKTKETLDFYSGDVLTLQYGYRDDIEFPMFIGYHKRIQAFRLYYVGKKTSKSASIGTLNQYIIINVSNILAARLMLALNGYDFSLEDYFIEEVSQNDINN